MLHCRLAVALSFVGLVAKTTLAQSSGAPLLLNAAPQNQAVYLSWNRGATNALDLAWRPYGGTGWEHVAVSGSFYTLGKLQNGVRYQFQLTGTRGDGGRVRSSVIEETPRVRDDCDFGAAVFCTPEKLLAALPSYRMRAADLRCRDRAIGLTPETMPNCRFQLPGYALGLDRYSGGKFIPPTRLADPATVRSVLLQAIWNTDDPERMLRAARASITPLTIAYRGHVMPSAQARSYLVRLAPMLFSRITRFVPEEHIKGRYAIYHEGHGESAMGTGAEIIDWLLERGWEVWGIDMPLEGINGVDQRQPLLNHDDFPHVAADPSTGLRWFFQGIAAATALIAEDAPPGSTLMLVGRSGGAWTSYVYAGMDPHVDIVVNISGGSPASTQMDSSLFHRPSPHYENLLPYLSDQVSSHDLLLAGGSRATMVFYNTNDPCCYRFKADHPWIRFVNSLDASGSGKRYRAFVGNGAIHGLTPQAYLAWEQYLRELGLTVNPKSASTIPKDTAYSAVGSGAARHLR
jgi:hypothetical protein